MLTLRVAFAFAPRFLDSWRLPSPVSLSSSHGAQGTAPREAARDPRDAARGPSWKTEFCGSSVQWDGTSPAPSMHLLNLAAPSLFLFLSLLAF